MFRVSLLLLPGFCLLGFLLRFLVTGVLPAARAKLRKLELLRVGALVLRRGVVALPTVFAFEGDDYALGCHVLLRFLGST